MTATAVAVTGIGAVSALGPDTTSLWRAALDGRRGVRALDLFATTGHRTELAAQVDASTLPAAARRHATGRADRFACCAADEALRAVPETLRAATRLGVFFGSSTGALFEGERFLQHLLRHEEGDLHSIVGLQNDGPGNAVARHVGARGPVVSFSTACTSANVALGSALAALRAGECEMALAGGADELCEITYAGFNCLRAVDAAPSRPFRRDRQGLSMGEGAGVLLLETLEHARRRGAHVLAELRGAGLSCDAQHVSAPDPTGAGAAAAMRAALRDAAAGADEVTFVQAHGTGTPHNDVAEAVALRRVFGERGVSLPVTSTKGMHGHLLGAAGGIEAVLTVLSIVHGLLPATAGDEPADPDLGIDVVIGAPRRLPHHNLGLSTNLAFGGNNAVVLLGSPR